MSEANETLIDRDEREILTGALPQIGFCRHLIDLDKYCQACYVDRILQGDLQDDGM